MATWIALLRGINVGGNNPLPMKSLVSILEKLGCENVKTYIQSGNVVFNKSRLSRTNFGKQISKAVLELHGFEPHVLVFPASELQEVFAANPFPDATSAPNFLYVSFLAEKPRKPDIAGLDALKTKSEAFTLIGKAFYLHAPDGIGRSKLAAKAEKLLGVDATARNWRTVTKLLEMA